jgi:sRNA-binding regulator protein Hfq
VLEKASEIADRSGLNQKDAIRVALGKATVQQVLKEMMFREKVEALIRRHGLERSTACNVIRGSLDLDTAVLLQGIKESRAWNPERSVLTELKRQGGQGVFFVYGRSPIRASVTGVEKYDCWLAEPDRQPAQTEKHAILMACRPEEQARVEELRSTDKGVAGENLGPSVNYKDRFRSRKRVLFKHHRDKVRTRVTLRDGSVLEGEVEWFGKWEFGLRVDRDTVPVIFRHAMHRFEAVDSDRVAAEKRRKKR